MNEFLLSQTPPSIPIHLSIPIGLSLPDTSEYTFDLDKKEEDPIEEDLCNVSVIHSKKMDDLLQQVSVSFSKSSKNSMNHKTRKNRKH